MKLNFNSVAKEICKREESSSREVNITDVSRVMRHLFDILAEVDIDWQKNSEGHWPSPATNFMLEQLSKRIKKKQKAEARARKSKRPDKKGKKT